MIELDGSQGEGGGQVLRTALTLSALTGRPFRIARIRANRAKPGLMRQHLVAVRAVAAVCGAEHSPVDVGAQELEFHPGRVRGSEYDFDIGTAGSAALVLQAVLPVLLRADQPSRVTVRGGTHNPLAPPMHYLERVFGRVLRQMGVNVEFELRRFGFYPRGGGEVAAQIAPCAHLRALDLVTRGPAQNAYAEAFVAGLPSAIARRELDVVCASYQLGEANCRLCGLPADQGPGNVLLLTIDYMHVTELFSAIGERGVRAEDLAARVVAEARAHEASGAVAGEHLADQLLIPFALAGSGSFSMSQLSQHTLTNAEVVQRFLPVTVVFTRQDGRTLCTLEPGAVR